MSYLKIYWQQIFIFCLAIIIFIFFVFPDFSLAIFSCQTNNDCQQLEPDRESERTLWCAEVKPGKKKCIRGFEIDYPEVAGKKLIPDEIIRKGLPGYIDYIFSFAIRIVGFLIFGILIYNGVLYLISTGDPGKTKSARDGIFSAFLGALLLLFSSLIFKTINPQLSVLELPEIESLPVTLNPGIYLCNYEVDKSVLTNALDKYINSQNEDEREKAAEELKKIITNKNGHCQGMTASTDVLDFKITKERTIFAVPQLNFDPTTGEKKPEYVYGMVLHEKEKRQGKCYLLETEDQDKLYGQIKDYSAKNMKFNAYSVTVFQKVFFPRPEASEQEGVTLYEGLNFNDQPGTSTLESLRIRPDEKVDFKKQPDLEKLKDNTRSISFQPSDGSYFALLFEEGNFEKKCLVASQNQRDLFVFLPKTAECHKIFQSYTTPSPGVTSQPTSEQIQNFMKFCKSLIGSVIVVRGKVL